MYRKGPSRHIDGGIGQRTRHPASCMQVRLRGCNCRTPKVLGGQTLRHCCASQTASRLIPSPLMLLEALLCEVGFSVQHSTRNARCLCGIRNGEKLTVIEIEPRRLTKTISENV